MLVIKKKEKKRKKRVSYGLWVKSTLGCRFQFQPKTKTNQKLLWKHACMYSHTETKNNKMMHIYVNIITSICPGYVDYEGPPSSFSSSTCNRSDSSIMVLHETVLRRFFFHGVLLWGRDSRDQQSHSCSWIRSKEGIIICTYYKSHFTKAAMAFGFHLMNVLFF